MISEAHRWPTLRLGLIEMQSGLRLCQCIRGRDAVQHRTRHAVTTPAEEESLLRVKACRDGGAEPAARRRRAGRAVHCQTTGRISW